MGTRAVTYVIEDGMTHIASYTYSDGYPDGYGLLLMNFLTNTKNVKLLRERMRNVKDVSKESDALKTNDFNDRWFDNYIESHPEFSYFGGMDFFEDVIGSDYVTYRMFSGDPRGEDWTYVIDFDSNTFETYRGLSHTPPDKGERFYDGETVDEDRWYPPKLMCIFSLDDLPSNMEYIEKTEEKYY